MISRFLLPAVAAFLSVAVAAPARANFLSGNEEPTSGRYVFNFYADAAGQRVVGIGDTATGKAWMCDTEKCSAIHDPTKKACLPKPPKGFTLVVPPGPDKPWCD
jgi:hypothetical protein